MQNSHSIQLQVKVVNILDINVEELTELIRKIVDQQLKNKTNNIGFLYSGVIKSTDAGRFDVEIPSNGSVYTGLLNQSGTTLVIGDSVIIMVKGDKAGNSYITAKCGATVDGV